MRAAEWLEKLWPLILAGVMGLFGVFVGYRLNAGRAARLEHLTAIKAQVFRPLLADLESFYLPLLQEKLSPVVVEPKLTHLGGSINCPSFRWEYSLVPRTNTAAEQGPFPTEQQEPVTELNGELYRDAKRSHYAPYLNRLEKFKDAVNEYSLRWVLYTEYLSQTLVTKTGFAPRKEESANIDRAWIDANRLAVFILNWQLGIARHAPWAPPDSFSLEIGGQQVVRAESLEEVQKVRDCLELISSNNGRLEELRNQLPDLRRERTELAAQLQRLLFSSRLPGRCAFVKT